MMTSRPADSGDRLLLDQYRDYLENEAQRSKATCAVYLREAGFLLSWAREKGLDVATMTLGDLDAFICQRDDGLEARTVSRIDSSLRSFFTYLVKDRIREDNIALLLDKPRLEDYLPHALSVDQVDSILDAIRAKGADDLLFARDYGLKISSYNPQEHSLIVFGKRSKERLVFVGEVASLALDDYLANVRPVLAAANRKKARRTQKERDSMDALFLGRRGEMLTRQAMHKRYHAIVESLGIDATVHALRHSYATHLLKGGANIRQVQLLLGHADIRTTQIYTHLDTDDLLATFDKYSPLSREPGQE